MQAATRSVAGPRPQQPYSPWFWAGLGVLVLAQLVALVMLCSSQVRKAQDRDSQYVVQQMAVADCLQYVPGATVASCGRGFELVRATPEAAPENTVALRTPAATTVTYNYR